MNFNYFFQWIKKNPSHHQRAPPEGGGLKAGIAKCHLARKPRGSRASTDISCCFPPANECRPRKLKARCPY